MLDLSFWGKFEPELVRIRHHLHAHPELRHEEINTAHFVAECLTTWGIQVERGIGGHGLVGVLHGDGRSGTGRRNGADGVRSIGLRADMDALPMQERNVFGHASRHAGRMHACGHDGHTAMLLGAAHYLSRHRDFDGTVNFLFQPAEEGGAGARLMIEDGLFERCPMDAVFGMHNWPGIAAGKFAVRPDAIMASSNLFHATLSGKGAHAAQPHKSADPLMAAVQLVQAWQTIVSRNVPPNDPVVLSVTQLHAGSADNVIAERARISGTVRTFSVDVLDLVERRMAEIAAGNALASGVEIDFQFRRMYPPLVNHDVETQFATEVLRSVVGAENVDARVPPQTPSEDFAFYMQHRPGCFVFIGNGDVDAIPLHSEDYDFNDTVLKHGVDYWVSLTRAWLAR